MPRPVRLALPGLVLLLAATAAAQPFSPEPAWSAAVPDVERSAAAWGDLDGDGSPDLVVTGWTPGGRIGTVLRSTGGPTAVGTVAAVDLGALAWGDLDGDGRDDLALLGTRDDAQGTRVGEVYRSTGAGLVRDAAASAALPDLYDGALAWADLDGDGDPDLIVTGAANVAQTDTRGLVFRNDGGTLVLDAAWSAVLADVTGSALAVADLDGDGDPDLVVTGFDGTYAAVGEAYRNDGGTLVRDAGWSAAVPDVGAGALGAGDLDGDGDPDLVVTGGRVTPTGLLVLVGEVLRNDGGALVRDAARSAVVPDVFYSTVALGDADADGDVDLAVSGATATATARAVFRSAPGGLTLDAAATDALPAVTDGELAWADVDGDGDLDLLVTGTGPSAGVGMVLANLLPPPLPPVADAGPDQQRACAGPAGTAFTLDGSGSSDPEGAPLTYAWAGPFAEGGGAASGVGPTVTLPGARHVVTLTVTDPGGLTDTDTVTLVVVDTAAPAVALSGGAAVTVQRFSGPYADPGATASDACDGAVAPTVSGTVDTTLPGVYTLTYTATDVSGNTGQITRTVTVEDVDVPLRSAYAALAGRQLATNKHALVSGDLHANDRLQFKRGLKPEDGGPSRVVGTITSSRSIEIDDRQQVDGDLQAPTVDVHRNAIVTGTVTEIAVPRTPLPAVSVPPAGNTDIEVAEGTTLVLPPGTYGDVEVEKDGVLVLGSGTYVFQKLDVEDRARVDVRLTTGPTAIGIVEDLKLEKDAVLAPVPLGEADARFVTVEVAGDRVEFDDRARVAAQIIAPNADISLQDDVRVVGLVVGWDVELKEGAELVYLSGGPGSAALDDPDTDARPTADGLSDGAADATPPAALAAPYPNPARDAATVPFALRDGAVVRLTVHDALGREVAVLADGPVGPGHHAPRLDGRGLPAGVYLVRLVADGAVAGAGRLTLVR